MRNFDYAVESKTDSTQTNWFTISFVLLVVYVALIGGIELFWYYFAGGFSPILGELAFVTATLVAIRVVGEKLVAKHRHR